MSVEERTHRTDDVREGASPRLGAIAAVVPLFNPDEGVVRRLIAIREQVDRLVAVDDGSASPLTEHDRAALEAAGVTYRRRTANRGIAATINEGVRLALRDGAPACVVTFDQDSAPAPDCVRQLQATFSRARSAGVRVGIVALPLGALHARPDGFQEPHEPIQSGMLVDTALLAAIGGFRDEFFIDCVDTEFVLRARRHGWAVLVAPAAAMEHQLGAVRTRTLRILGRSLRLRANHHHPVRRYYIARNRLRLYAEYLAREPAWVVWSLRGELRILVLTVLVSDVPVKQLCATALGALAFLTRRHGRIGSVAARLLR